MKVDTEAQANIVPVGLWRQLKKRALLQMTETTLKSAGNSVVESESVAREVNMKCGDVSTSDTIFVSIKGSQAILGLKTSTAFGPATNGKNLRILEITAC